MRALDGWVAIVTGGSRGIGKGCALELGAAGALVYLTGRTVAPGEAKLPGTIGATAAEVEALFERVGREQGRLDVLVNNAFLIPPELVSGLPFWRTPVSNWDDMIDVGLRSAYVASRCAALLMVPRRAGLIVNISSSGAVEYAWHVAYGVGKAGLDRLTADTAHELREHGVAVVSLWPGFVRTERVESWRGRLPSLDVDAAESPRFSGRAVVARDLALAYGFRDVDGRLPAGPLHGRPRGDSAA